MENHLFLTIILLELAILMFGWFWFDEIWNLFQMGKIYFWIAYVSILWILHCGNKSYRLIYNRPGDEAGEKRVIEFPAVWM